MALETISQILSPTNATYVNGVSARRTFSAAVIKNMYQGLVETGGRGIDDKFVSESDAVESAQVFVNRILPIRMKPREQGANKNGASFSANQHYVQTETVQIELLQVMDDVVVIPRARQDMIPTDLLAEQTKIFSDRLRTVINGATFACKLFKVWNETGEIYSTKLTDADISNKEILYKFVTANSLLDEGDSEHGVDIFPEDTRVCVVKPSYRALLKINGVLTLGGANYAYDIAKGGAISHEDKPSKVENGYIGDIDGVPCHIISNESISHASEFLGFEASELKLAPVVGYISSSWANARGVSSSKITKIVDAQEGQGLKLQPYVKFGVASWFAKGTSLLSRTTLEADAIYNPFASLKSLFASYLSGITFKLKGAGSRLVPEVEIGTISGSGASVDASAKDDWNNEHVLAYAYYVGTAAPKTIGEFAAGYAAATLKGVEAVGDAIEETLTGSGYVCVLAISSDGSTKLASKSFTIA